MNKIFETKPSVKIIYQSIIINLLFFIIASYMFLLLRGALAQIGFNISIITSYASIVLLIIVLFNVIKACITAYTVHYSLTESSFMYQSGLFNLKTENLELFRVVDISLFRPIHHRIFGLADIVLHTIDRTTPTLVLKGIENYGEIENQLKIYISKKRPNVIESVHTHNDIEINEND